MPLPLLLFLCLCLVRWRVKAARNVAETSGNIRRKIKKVNLMANVFSCYEQDEEGKKNRKGLMEGFKSGQQVNNGTKKKIERSGGRDFSGDVYSGVVRK